MNRTVVSRVAAIFEALALVWFISIIVLMSSGQPAYAADSVLPPNYESQVTRAMKGLERFQRSHSVNDLLDSSRALIGSVGFVNVQAPPLSTIILFRRRIVTGYAQILSQIETLRDPAFLVPNTPDYTAYLCPPTPIDANGQQGFSCIDPSFYQDRTIREKYIADIKANDEKKQRINMQRTLENADGEITNQLQVSLRILHRDGDSDGSALDAILQKERLSASRRASVHAMYAMVWER